ncbi:CDK-activating kinase assembly factor MAT1-domain-containing protein [Immersiella caudata]|uniref:RNA polymerase II transcription factor B subunit 3 n=1 Tax=Immersiella caudata TaxID=314043 RepID=A0AA40CD39_9PEZI|nr:CDK-activating kinase assembly factor MAT1-domain-containing protein [Immersiella caudata]
MSRKAAPAAVAARAGTASSLPISIDDMCPVCKTMRYLNKDMEFLINTECYHSMCSNCVNRLFNDGPNQCPYAGCHRTLRRKGFRSAFFGDLSVEREVDIRRRVAAVFNQAEDDFETLRDYNNYLQMVEDLTFDLVSGNESKRRNAEAQLQAWEASHKAEIERNRKAGREADEQARRRQTAEKEAARQRRLDAIREAEDEKRGRLLSREAELDSMASADGGQRVQLKRRGQTSRVETAVNTAMATADVGKLSIRGLKERKVPAPDVPYDPFGGMRELVLPSRYSLEDGLSHPGIDKYRYDQGHTTGGYDFDEYTARVMFEAFAGLGVFIEDEKEAGIGLSTGQVATIAAGIAAVGDKMELD